MLEPREAEVWLESLINVERLPDLRRARLSLEPVRRLLGALGHPEAGLRVLHVAGSKGKGSTALLAEAVLRAGGLRVGTFTSPHLERWTERFRIDGAEVEGNALAAAVTRIRPPVDALRGEADAPSFFDATTAAALCLFAEARLDAVILEVGLGGRLDSTNAVEPAVCCVTSIELEHTEKLGTTLAAIAAEKAGIAKPGVPLVAGALPEEAAAVVESRAEALGCPLARLGREIDFEVLEGSPLESRFRTVDGPVALEARLAWPGEHQARNAALALACVRRLGLIEDARLPALAAAAFTRVRLPGRIEVLGRKPWILVDSAHTVASAAALARVLDGIPRRASHLVLSVSGGKDLAGICSVLAARADRITVTRADPIRSLKPVLVAEAVRAIAPRCDLRVVPNPHLALRAAREGMADDELLCATGSVYLAGIARRVLAQAGGAGG
jgi:dihydrofolate synthase/folylpolyglutamate synthase